MKKDLYEERYTKKNMFSFGKNWSLFLQTLTVEQKEEAKKSLKDFLGVDTLEGKTFVDVGCGSGLFSLAAYLLGAKKIISFDIDTSSIACAEQLRKEEKSPKHWEIHHGSALDASVIKPFLKEADIVYSWGVLHHTGDMYKALDIISNLSKDTALYIALYNKYEGLLSSQRWNTVKRRENYFSNIFFKKIKS